VGDKLRDTFDSQVVMISQYDPETERVYHHYAIERGVHLQLQEWSPIDVSRSKVVKTKKMVMINAEEIMELLGAAQMHVVPGTEVPRTWLGVPMLVGGEARGIVSLQNLDKENAFSASDVQLLTTLTNSLSLSLENARLFNETQRLLKRLETEMELARQAQQSILPMKLPTHPDYDLGSLIIPAQAVGGDFYDFIPLRDQKMCIVIGDVSDKGLSSALFMAVTLSLLRAETSATDDQYQILQTVNQFLLKMNARMFVTLLYCVLDFNTGMLTYSRAGHLPPVILDDKGDSLQVVTEKGLPLGLVKEVKIDFQQVTIPRGGVALLHSDGLNEALDSQGKLFGFQRIREEMRTHRGEQAEAICRQLWEAVKNYSGDLPHQDDFTTVVIKRRV
jgi:sigma-B regulation protein RsbU (phosphoserine phosphatase)